MRGNAVTNPTAMLGLTVIKRMLAREGGSNENSLQTWPFCRMWGS